jgi:hypothetical protein
LQRYNNNKCGVRVNLLHLGFDLDEVCKLALAVESDDIIAT